MEQIEQSVLRLTTPEGEEYSFRYAAGIPHKGVTYAVLIQTGVERGKEQLLVTRAFTDEEGALGFEIVDDESVVEAVFEGYVGSVLGSAMAGNDENAEEHECCHEDGCGCCHDGQKLH
ncbi:MAG: hypothetical protein PHI27_09160 [Eubacteriales bacterium]|nr:hypothetical protein [Eubacteriales bacterium]MDD3882409.1 hypothetical protein [Eubacteriales bacterium]MDD4512370.1 hypothetical protein [Eubacteriales bacterium]